MASSTSFKQQCPSCEAMVPIRDPALVGRKIDCPKCKYRFVVERPEDEEDDDAPAPPKKKSAVAPAGKSAQVKKKPTLRRRDEDEDDEDERPQKKKSGASTTLILGGVLGLLAVGLLGVGALFALGVFGGPAKSDNGGSGSGSGSSASSNSGPEAAVNPTEAGDGKKDAPVTKVNVSDISNLLPNDSEAVVNYQIDKLSSSSLRDAVLQTPGAFNESGFKDTFGFPLYDAAAKDGVQRVVTAVNNSKGWVFTAMRTMKPINRQKLIDNLGLVEGTTVKGLTAYTITRDLDSLSNLLIKANRSHPDLQVCLFDGLTLVFADKDPMAKFLADGGRPKQLSLPQSASTAPPAGGSSTSPGGSTTPGGSMRPGGSMTPGGSMRPGGSMTPGGSMRPGGSMTPGGSSPHGEASASAPAPAVAGSYLTINPGIKALFDQLEKPDQPALFSIVLPSNDPLVQQFDHYVQDRALSIIKAKGFHTDDPMFGPGFDKQKNVKLQDVGIRLVGLSVTAFSQDKIGGAVAVDFKSEIVARTTESIIQPQISRLNAMLNGEIPFGPPPPDGNPMGNGFPPPGGSASGFRPGGSSRPGGLTPAFRPGGSSRPGGLTPAFRPGGSSSDPDISRPGGSSSNFRPGGGFPGFGPGGNQAEGKRGPLEFVADKSVVAFSATLPFVNDAMFQDVEQELAKFMIHLKGESDLLSTRSRIHDLAAALMQYVKANGHFPRGTADRRATADQFAGWAPDQRVSWTAELLPYLGGGEYTGLRIDPQKSWNEGDNLTAAGVLIPQFLGLPNAAAPPFGHYPGVASEVAMTNYVGVAGVGLDAADDAPGNPKDGIFGYNRETKTTDVKRGLDQTIALLQAPSEGTTPWLAGGGATVRGVSDGPDALKPFVCAEYKGKRGTFAVMADGKVRFIPETMDPKIFRTLCLIVGDKVENLDKIAPIVPGDGPEPKAAAPPVAAN